MRTTKVKTTQKGVVRASKNVYVLYEDANVVLLQFDIFGCARIHETIFVEPWLSFNGVWVSPFHDCSINLMSLFTFPEFGQHSVFAVSAIKAGRSVAVCLVKGDVFDLK